jgi:hypothetical protein
MNHVFVDFENVHEVDLALIGAKSVNLTLMLGPRQTRLDTPLVEKLLEHAATVQIIRLTKSAKNALDFALAYYLGRAVLADPTGHFHIVSGDAGYDPLIEHLRSRHIHAERHDDCAPLTTPAPASASAPSSVPAPPTPRFGPRDHIFCRIVDHLRKQASNRPKRKKTLVRNLLAFCGPTVVESEALDMVESLRQAGHLSIGPKDAITYPDQIQPKPHQPNPSV